MSFYPEYLAFFKKIHQRIKHSPDVTQVLGTLLAGLHFPDKPLEISEIENLLKELHHIDEYLKGMAADEEVLQARELLLITLAEELNVTIKKTNNPIPPLQLEKWLRAHFEVGKELITLINYDAWLQKELKENNYRYGYHHNNEKLNMLTVVLTRALSFGEIPPKEWYDSIDELKLFDSHDAVLKLAYSDLKAFQNLDQKYPGFLFYLVSSFDDLSIFCQLLPKTYIHLLNAPQVKPYRSNIVDYIRILEDLIDLSLRRKYKLAQKEIKNIDDLVAVTNAFPSYFCLIAYGKNITDNSQTVMSEGICAHLIQTKDDLMRFDLSDPQLQLIIQKTPRLRALIGTSPTYVQSIMSLFQNKKSIKESSQQTQALDPRFLTLGQAINSMQFQEGAGYYDNGNIEFSNGNKNGHFSTEATDGYGLAIALSHQAFKIWQQVSLEHQRCFELLECGAGEGDLCAKMFYFIKTMAKENKDWALFEKAIHYTIIELSAVLVERQKHKLKKLIIEGRVEVLQGDALKMTQYNKQAALHISNELMDMLPSEQIIIDEHEACQVMMCIPVLIPEAFDYLKLHYPEQVWDLCDEVDSFKILLEQKKILIDHHGFPLTAQRFRQLLSITAKKNFAGPSDCFFFSKATLPLSLFPDIEQYLLRHEEILTSMRPTDTKVICPQLDVYARLMTEKALVSIVIDYGSVTFKLKNVGYRSYGSDSPFYKNIPLRNAGKIDITYDVDFSALVTGLKYFSPGGRSSLVLMGKLMPEMITLPKSFQLICGLHEIEAFRQSKFLTVAYVSPQASVTLDDIETRLMRVVTRDQFFSLSLNRAQRILELNELDLQKLTN